MPELNDLVEVLRTKVAEAKFVDVGEGTARAAGVSIVKLRTALATLRSEGYKVYRIKSTQTGSNAVTILRILTLPENSFMDTYKALKQASVSSL